MAWLVVEPDTGSEPTLRWFAAGLRRRLAQEGLVDGTPMTSVVWNLFERDRPRGYRRQRQAVFVVGVTAGPRPEGDVLAQLYPLLIRSLGNMLVYLVAEPGATDPGTPPNTVFVTLERGYYLLLPTGRHADYFGAVLQRVRPLAASRLVIDNVFVPDLPEELRLGNARTAAIAEASRRLKALDLLPAPFPIDRLLPPDEYAHLRRLFQLGGLSYGNASVREPGLGFWMSASGVDKSRLRRVGDEILLVRGYDAVGNRMVISVPAGITPRRVSVDAIEHWMVYRRFPRVGAILHVHAWMDGVPVTDVNYPCGTLELATAVCERLEALADPVHAAVGLRNHGLTITGESLPEIFARVEPHLRRQVPMQ